MLHKIIKIIDVVSFIKAFYFFIDWFTDIFTEDLATEGEITIKIKYITFTKHLIKMVCNIFYYSKTAKIDSNITNIR